MESKLFGVEERRNRVFTEKEYELYMDIINRIIKDTESSVEQLPRRKWMASLNYEQWCRFQRGELKMFDPIND